MNKMSDMDNYSPMDLECTWFPFLELPHELCSLVCSQVDTLKDWSSLSRSCRFVHELCNSNIVWRVLTQKVFSKLLQCQWDIPHDVIERAIVSGSGCWKAYCFEATLLHREPFKWINATGLLDHSSHVVPSTLPSPRLGHTGCAVDDRTIVYIGGYNDESPPRFNDIYFYDTRVKRFDLPKINGTPYRIARHASVFINGTIYSFGGYDGEGTFYGLSAFDVGSCTFEYPAVSFGKEPGRRTNHAAVAVKDKLYIYGGNKDENNVYAIYDDMQMFDTKTKTWTNLTPYMKGDLPGKVIGHKMLSIGNTIYLIGGGIWFPKHDSWSSKYNTVYSFNTETMEWKKLTVNGDQLGVCTFTMVWVHKSFIFVFGGQEMNSEVVSRNIWVFDTVSQTGRAISLADGSKSVLARDMGTTNFVHGGVVSFAGSSGSAVNNVDILHHKLFELDGSFCTKQRLGDF